MALRNFLQGRTESDVISKPANSTVSWANMNLSGFSVMPFLPHRSSYWTALKKLSLMVSDQSKTSSMHLVLLGISETNSSYRLV